MLKLVGILRFKNKTLGFLYNTIEFSRVEKLTKQHLKHISVNQIQEPTDVLSCAVFNFNWAPLVFDLWTGNELWLVGTWMKSPESRLSPSCKSKDHPIPLGAFKWVLMLLECESFSLESLSTRWLIYINKNSIIC